MALRFDASALAPDAALARRWRARPLPTETVTVEHDGHPVTAVAGEPVAIALLAAGRPVLARSPKYHRPRGPTCLRGACDGCLVRLDGAPNVMACRARARSGMKVTSQNAFPTAGVDLLRVTDWFFARGMDHHHLLAETPHVVNAVMQSFARRMSGLGTLPDDAPPVRAAREVTADVLVVGAGPAGCAAATALSLAGLRVTLVDSEPDLGGSRRDDPDDALDLDALPPTVDLRLSTTAVATYDDGTLLADAEGVTLVRAHTRVFATGSQPYVSAFENNDLPGVMTARALARAMCHGVMPGARVLIVGDDRFARAVARSAPRGVAVTHRPTASLIGVDGARAVKRARLSTKESIKADVVAVAGEHGAAYELAGQAGAQVAWSAARDRFEPVTDDEGATTAPGVYAAGSLRMGDVDVGSRAGDGARVAARALRELRGGDR